MSTIEALYIGLLFLIAIYRLTVKPQISLRRYPLGKPVAYVTLSALGQTAGRFFGQHINYDFLNKDLYSSPIGPM